MTPGSRAPLRGLTGVGLVVITLASLSVVLMGCAAIAPLDQRDLPTLRMKTDRLRPDPQAGCVDASRVTLLRGPVPAGTQVVATVKLTAVDRAASLATFESVLREWSAKHCVQGISVLKAELLEAGPLVLEVVADTWIVVAAPSEKPSAPAAQPDPERTEAEFWE